MKDSISLSKLYVQTTENAHPLPIVAPSALIESIITLFEDVADFHGTGWSELHLKGNDGTCHEIFVLNPNWQPVLSTQKIRFVLDQSRQTNTPYLYLTFALETNEQDPISRTPMMETYVEGHTYIGPLTSEAIMAWMQILQKKYPINALTMDQANTLNLEN